MELPLTPLEFARRARKLYPHREAVVDGPLRLTYAQFFERCDRWSAVLQSLGVGQGDRVAIIAPNTHAMLEAFYAVPQIGAVLVPLNYRLTAEDFVYAIRHSGSRVVCSHTDYLAELQATKFNFAAQGTITGPGGSTAGNSTIVNEQLTLPLPSIGLVANYNITPKLQFQSRYDIFYLTIGDYTGAMFEFYAGLEYRLHKHFAMGAAFDRLQAGLRGSGQQGFNVNFSYNLAYVYATLYAF